MNLDNIKIPSDKIIVEGVQEIDVEGFSIFKKEDDLLNSTLVGVKIKYIIGGLTLWHIVKNKLKNI